MTYYCVYVLMAAKKFRKNLPPLQSGLFPFVSVIIPARNEAFSISACLHSVINQNYPADRFEVILINDHSEDQTGAIASEIASASMNLTVIDLQDEDINSFKKAAVARAVSLSKGEIILQTDADCVVSRKWISAMTGFFDSETALVSGPVQFTYRNSWFEKVQTLEFLGLNLLGAGGIAMKRPNMCNGANLAYRKAVFEEVNGFQGVDNVASGDDELLLQKIYRLKKYKIRYACAESAIVKTAALSSLAAFFNQRLRWVSKSRSYLNRWINVTQLLFFLAICGIPLLFGLSFISIYMLIPAVIVFGMKILSDIPLMIQATRFFREKKLLKWFLLLEVLYIPYVILIGIAGNLISSYSWKGRKVR
ncbi:MAG: glycosyltransferase [Bacteroidia bacterium]|nr:glycosyltransferase [Bacteroidia bacterium]